MKTYFTKYLPVEGEIKSGDLVNLIFVPHPHIDTLGLKVKEIFDESYLLENGYNVYKRDAQKVKLFLCSKDIQVGDKVWNNAVNLECGTAEELHDDPILDCVKEDGPHWMCIDRDCTGNISGAGDIPIKQLFKIIAEISPEAIWVNESDEFDETDVHIKYQVTFKKPDDPKKVTIWTSEYNTPLYWKWYEKMSFFPEQCTPEFIVGHQNGTECKIPRNICIDISTVKVKCSNCNTFH